MIQTVRIIICDPSKKILLLQKSRESKNPFSFELPGGKIDDGQSIIDAVIKETIEETGINVDPSKINTFVPLPTQVYSFQVGGKTYHREVYYFLYEISSFETFAKQWNSILASSFKEDKHISYTIISINDFENIKDQISENSRKAVERFFQDVKTT
jgi:8-oxo-dGTP pyrophosphatase MutT (NUDIX family)